MAEESFRDDSAPADGADDWRADSGDGESVRKVQGWWAAAWLRELVQGTDTTSQAAGRSLWEKGAVQQLSVDAGRVTAVVEQPTGQRCPVTLQFRAYDDGEWERIVSILSGQAMYAAQLLNGELPAGLQSILGSEGTALFPSGRAVAIRCGCSGHSHRCIHSLAVIYAVSHKINDDPFLLFMLRGQSREDLVLALREQRAQENGEEAAELLRSIRDREHPANERLDADLQSFWHMGDDIRGVRIRVEEPEVEMELVKVLGEPRFAEGTALRQRLVDLYRQVTQRALSLAFGLDDAAEDEN